MALRNGPAPGPPGHPRAESGGAASGVILRLMSKPGPGPSLFIAAAFRRLRPDSERALRLMRLAFLIGWSAPVIAAQFALSRATLYRRLNRHGLRGPEAPGERDRLLAEELSCSLADALLRGDGAAAKEIAALQQKQNAAARQKAASPDPPKEEHAPYTE